MTHLYQFFCCIHDLIFLLHPRWDHLVRHLLIAIDAGLLCLEYTFAMVLRLLRRLYPIVGEDSHFGYFASVSKMHLQ